VQEVETSLSFIREVHGAGLPEKPGRLIYLQAEIPPVRRGGSRSLLLPTTVSSDSIREGIFCDGEVGSISRMWGKGFLGKGGRVVRRGCELEQAIMGKGHKKR